jgi:hypothetical protein
MQPVDVAVIYHISVHTHHLVLIDLMTLILRLDECKLWIFSVRNVYSNPLLPVFGTNQYFTYFSLRLFHEVSYVKSACLYLSLCSTSATFERISIKFGTGPSQ